LRETYVYCPEAGAVVERWRAARGRGDNGAPSLLGKPFVFGVMPETRHIIDRKVYDSREKFNAVTRAHGAEECGKTEMRRLVERGPRVEESGPSVKQSLKEALQRDGFL
jgi:hypothetical protein